MNFNQDIYTSVVNQTLQERGGTFSPNGGHCPYISGYMIALQGYQTILPISDFTAREVESYLSLARKLAKKMKVQVFVGTWVFQGKIYLDISVHSFYLENALSFARDNGQTAIYDLSAKREIYV